MLRPNALPISGSLPAPKMIMIMTSMIINSGNPIPIIRKNPPVKYSLSKSDK
jgi:hypothetical protein